MFRKLGYGLPVAMGEKKQGRGLGAEKKRESVAYHKLIAL